MWRPILQAVRYNRVLLLRLLAGGEKAIRALEKSGVGVKEKHYAKTCKVCGRPLPAHRRNTCTANCKKRRTKETVSVSFRACQICGKDSGARRRKYCSPECQEIGRKKTIETKEVVPKKGKFRSCLKCDVMFFSESNWVCPKRTEINASLYEPSEHYKEWPIRW